MRRTWLALAVLGGCDVRVVYPKDEVPADPDIDTDLPDTDLPDTAAPPTPDCDLGWWPGADLDGDGQPELPYRILVDVRGPPAGLGRAPVAVDLDLRAALDALGDDRAPDPASLRVVLQRCDRGMPEVPAQWSDRLVSLHMQADHVAPAGDDAGAVVFLADLDGDPATPEPLDGAPTLWGVYFAAAPGAPAPRWPTDLTLTDDGRTLTLGNATTTATLDAEAGGLLSTLSFQGSPSLLSQTASCCGNGMSFWSPETIPGPPFGWVVPQGGPGTLEVLAQGPVLTAVRATGHRDAVPPDGSASWGAYDYEVLYWQFARRPEVWHVAHHVATSECTTAHELEASYGFRPLQLRHTLADVSLPTFEDDQDERWGAVFHPDLGFAYGVVHPARHHARVANPVGAFTGGPLAPSFVAVHGNEHIAPGIASPATVPAGSAIFSHVGVVLLPFDDWATARPRLRALLQGVTASPRPPERHEG